MDGLEPGEVVLLTPPLKAATVEASTQSFGAEPNTYGVDDSGVYERVNSKLEDEADKARPSGRQGGRRDENMSAPESQRGRERFKNMSPEERQKMRERFENMSPQEREKMRQRRRREDE
jgi:hypothetical protein